MTMNEETLIQKHIMIYIIRCLSIRIVRIVIIMHKEFMKKSHKKNIVQLIIRGYKWHCRKMEFYILRALVKCHLFYVYIIWYLNDSILVHRQGLLILLTVVKIQMLTELKSYYDLLSYIYIHIYMCVLSMCIHKCSLANNVKPSTFKCQADRVIRRFDVNYRLTESPENASEVLFL